MLASAVGMKLADNFRRVSLYGKSWHQHKAFFAISRGLFPVHELCASLVIYMIPHRKKEEEEIVHLYVDVLCVMFCTQ
jgi:hypothetical protein